LAPTVGIAATGFGIRAGSFNFSIDDISKFFLHHQDQQRVQPKIHGARIRNNMKKSRSANFATHPISKNKIFSFRRKSIRQVINARRHVVFTYSAVKFFRRNQAEGNICFKSNN
jgi:hypothetical protein